MRFLNAFKNCRRHVVPKTAPSKVGLICLSVMISTLALVRDAEAVRTTMFTFCGHVTSIDSHDPSQLPYPWNQVSVGDPWNVAYTFDCDAPDAEPSPLIGSYPTAISTFTVTVGLASITRTTPAATALINIFSGQPPGYDQYETWFNWDNDFGMFFQCDDDTGTAWNGHVPRDGLPCCLTMSAFSLRDWTITIGEGFEQTQIHGLIDDCFTCEPPLPPCKTWTSGTDFQEGNLFNLTPVIVDGDSCLSLNDEVRTWPFIAVACSNRGTVTRINVNSGAVVGEYLTAPDDRGKDPSRTSCNAYGDIAVGNRAEQGMITYNGQQVPAGSVVVIGIIEGGERGDRIPLPGGGWGFSPNPSGEYIRNWTYSTCSDRDGDGYIHTSRGLGDILPWHDVTDGDGGLNGGDALVEDATDEAITIYQRLPNNDHTRHVSFDANNDLWVGGTDGTTQTFHKLARGTGAILASYLPACGGYGGFIDGAGVLWSANGYNADILRYNIPGTPPPPTFCITQPLPAVCAYGMGIDRDCDPWSTDYYQGTVVKLDPQGVILPGFPKPTGGNGPKGVAVRMIDNTVWVANTLSNTVSHLDSGGNPLEAPINLAPWGGTSPMGVAVDLNGKVWVVNYGSNNAMRINPGSPSAVDKVVDLGAGAGPYNYSDMTGEVLLKSTAPQGNWTVTYDGGVDGTVWDKICWNAHGTPGTSVTVEVRTWDAQKPPTGWTTVVNCAPLSTVFGRYLQIRATLSRPVTCSGEPVGNVYLCDLTVCKVPPCMKMANEELLCPLDSGGPLTYSVDVTNLSGQTVGYVLFTPQSGGISFNPAMVPVSIPNGQTASVTTQVLGWTPGQEFCFSITLFNFARSICCTIPMVCRTPLCDCFQIPRAHERIDCGPPPYDISYTFQFDNLTSQTIENVFLYPPAGTTIYPQYFHVPPIPPGGTSGPLTVEIQTGLAPGSQLCFSMSLHDRYMLECCAASHCIIVPQCDSIPPPSEIQGTEGSDLTFKLFQNEPNPFRPPSQIRFWLAGPSQVRLEVFDAAGRRVRTLIDERRVAGRYAQLWDAKDDQGRLVSAGVYFYRLKAGEFVDTRRMIVLK